MNRLKEIRKKAGISQTDLAITASVHPSTLNRIERGVRPNRKTAESLASALGLPLADVFPDAEQLRRY
jgi:DNA-binding XRE family transcriptional regulator